MHFLWFLTILKKLKFDAVDRRGGRNKISLVRIFLHPLIFTDIQNIGFVFSTYPWCFQQCLGIIHSQLHIKLIRALSSRQNLTLRLSNEQFLVQQYTMDLHKLKHISMICSPLVVSFKRLISSIFAFYEFLEDLPPADFIYLQIMENIQLTRKSF